VLDEIRRDMESRLAGMLDEAERLRAALAALGGPVSNRRGGSASGRGNSARSTSTRANARASSPRAARPRKAGATRQSRDSASPAGRRGNRNGAPPARSTGTKGAVLAALASGEAMTASQVAEATGLGRASVSTTLSKLAKSGEVRKAARGYERAG